MTDPVDAHIGKRIRERRKALKMSQSDLAAAIGVSAQQASKYELGSDRVSAATLWRIVWALDVPAQWFFEGCGR